MAATWDLVGQLREEPPGVYLCTSDQAPLDRVQWVSQPDPTFSAAAQAQLSDRQKEARANPNRQAVRSKGGCVRIADRPRDLFELRVEGQTGTPFYVVDNKSNLAPASAPPITICDLFWTDGCRFTAPFYGRSRFRDQAVQLHGIFGSATPDQLPGPSRYVCSDHAGVAIERKGGEADKNPSAAKPAAAAAQGQKAQGEATAVTELVQGRCAAIGPGDDIKTASAEVPFEAVQVFARGQTNQPPPAAWICQNNRPSFFRKCVQTVDK